MKTKTETPAAMLEPAKLPAAVKIFGVGGAGVRLFEVIERRRNLPA
jgi:cell division GTPase FtsZ